MLLAVCEVKRPDDLGGHFGQQSQVFARGLVGDVTEPALDETRQEDREAFRTTLPDAVSGVALTEDQAASWMRVIGDARLMFAARLGIEDNRWERRVSTDPEMRLVHYLTYLQSGLIEALDELLDGD